MESEISKIQWLKKKCFDCMTRSYQVLEEEQKDIALQSSSTNWSGKPQQLDKYQRIRERRLAARKERIKLLAKIKKHSNYKKVWHKLAEFEDRILTELLGRIEKRTLLIWQKFEFDDDGLNRKYKVGRYYDDPERKYLVERISTLTISPFLSNQIPSITVTDTNGEQQNIVTNKRTSEHSTMDDKSNSNTDQQQPSAKRARLAESSFVMPLPPDAVCTQRNSSDIHNTTTTSSILPSRPITTTEAPEYSLDYIKSSTNIYELAIYKRMQKFPNTQLTPEKVDKIIKAIYDFYRPSFAQLEMPTILRKLNLHEQMDFNTKGAYAWACEQLGIPIATVPVSRMPAVESVPEPVQEPQIITRPDSESYASLPTEENTPTVEMLPEPNTMALMPPVYPTQSKGGSPEPSGVENLSSALKPPAVVQTNETVPSTPPENDTIVVIKQETDASPNDTSGYEGYVEEMPFLDQVHVMDDSPENLLQEFEPPEPNTEENTPNVEMLPQPNTMAFMPPVHSTQSHDGSSMPSEEEKFPSVLKPPTVVQSKETVASYLADNDTVVFIKQGQESDASSNDMTNTSGYGGYVEETPCPDQVPMYIDDTAQNLLAEFVSPERNAVQSRPVGLLQVISNYFASLFSSTKEGGGN